MSKNLQLIYLFLIAIVFNSCNKSDDGDSSGDEAFYKIIVNGNGGVSTLSEDGPGNLEIAQAIPSVNGAEFPSNIPIMLFFNSKLYLPSITKESFIIKENNSQIGGIITVNEAANGFAVLTFIPKKKFSPNAEIEVTVTTDLLNNAGNGQMQETSITFSTTSTESQSFSSNGNFEMGSNGVLFIGDGNIMTGTHGCVAPVSGSNFAAITTGNGLISSNNSIGNATSMMILGPIESNVSQVGFKYNFMSAEFQEYVNSAYDDTFMAVVVGANGAFSDMITSVNTVGTSGNTQCVGFPGMPDSGDGYSGSTGWINKTLNFSNVGGQAYIIFLVTDVSDTIYSSVVCIDDVTF